MYQKFRYICSKKSSVLSVYVVFESCRAGLLQGESEPTLSVSQGFADLMCQRRRSAELAWVKIAVSVYLSKDG